MGIKNSSRVTPVRFYSSKTFSTSIDIRSDTLRKKLSLDGHVYGIRPVKLPSGRNLWPAAEIEALLSKCANGGRGKEADHE